MFTAWWNDAIRCIWTACAFIQTAHTNVTRAVRCYNALSQCETSSHHGKMMFRHDLTGTGLRV